MRTIKEPLSGKDYEKALRDLQVDLCALQEWVKHKGLRVVVVFEGRDAAGKGGTIKRFMEHLNPRGAQVVALEKPSERETTLARLKDASVPIEAETRFTIYFRDPDGRKVGLSHFPDEKA